jgi:hypothetical protein
MSERVLISIALVLDYFSLFFAPSPRDAKINGQALRLAAEVFDRR